MGVPHGEQVAVGIGFKTHIVAGGRFNGRVR